MSRPPRPSASRRPARPGSTRRTLLRGLAVAIVGGLAIVAIGGILLWREIEKELPAVEKLSDYQPSVASQVFAADGSPIGEFYFEKRYLVPLEEIPPIVRQAFVAAEDASFYEHRGVDFASIARAFVNNLVAGGVVQGGSTITQQVVKALLLTPERSYERKIKEIVLSFRLERQLTKDEILYLYLNQIYLGTGAYGVAAAAQEYFGKTVDELTLAEAALLAGLPQAPSRYSPTRHPERAKHRQVYVLDRMLAEGYVDRATRDAAAALPLRLARDRAPLKRTAPHYVEHVRRVLQSRYGDGGIYQAGLQIHTAVDPEMQAAAEAAVRDGLKDLDRRRGYRGPMRRLEGEDAIGAFLDEVERELRGHPLSPGSRLDAVVMGTNAERATLMIGARAAVLPLSRMKWAPDWKPGRFQVGDVILVEIVEKGGDGIFEVALDQHPEVEGALLAIESGTGHVRAMVGGYDFGRSEFNRATQALRQPGSAFKPFVYAAAFDRGFTPASIVIDAPVVFDDWNRVWKPSNYEEKWHGPTRLRDALTHSRNVISVKLARDVGLPYLTGYLPRFGFAKPFPQNLSISLGTSEVTLLELVRAYDVFATQGRLTEPIFITRITDRAGNVLEEVSPSSEEALSPQTAYLTTSILQDVIRRGTGRRAAALGRPAAGKTGTTNDAMDAWFVGFTPDLVAGAWVGFDEKKPLGRKETGGRAALPIWLSFMQKALEGKPVTDFPVPKDIVFVNIDRQSGLRASPVENDILLECFRRGSEPQQFARAPEEVRKADFFRGDF
jgi:penicillin-binding protein 1A